MITQTKNSTNKINPDDSRDKEMPFVAVISKFYPNTLEFCSNKLFNSNNTVKFMLLYRPTHIHKLIMLYFTRMINSLCYAT